MSASDTPSMPTTQAEWEAHWAFYQLAVKERDFERLCVNNLREELTAANAQGRQGGGE